MLGKKGNYNILYNTKVPTSSQTLRRKLLVSSDRGSLKS